MLYTSEQIEIDVTIRKFELDPTIYTGERLQKPNKHVKEELTYNKTSATEAIRILLNYVRD